LYAGISAEHLGQEGRVSRSWGKDGGYRAMRVVYLRLKVSLSS